MTTKGGSDAPARRPEPMGGVPGLAEALAPYRMDRPKEPSRTGTPHVPPNILSCLLAVQEALRCVPPARFPRSPILLKRRRRMSQASCPTTRTCAPADRAAM